MGNPANARLALAGCLLALAAARPASAQDGALTEQAAIERAVAHNPGLAAALLDAQRASLDERAEKDIYPLVFEAGANGSRTTIPGLANGGVTFSTGNSVSVWTGLGKTFSTGTSLSLDVTGTMDHREAGNAEGPGYGLTGRLTLAQPLLRGFGTRVGEASLRQARLARVAGQRKAERVASELLRDVLVAWWELWYDSMALAIQEDARKLAESQLAQVEARIARGTLAQVEALSYRTALASREEELAQSQDVLRRQALELLRLMGTVDDSPDGLVAAGGLPDQAAAEPVPANLEELAALASFQLREIEASVEQARVRASVAGESSRPKLDLSVWLQGQGLGNATPAPAFEQIGKAQAGGAFVGLTFEMPVTGSRKATERAAAAVAVQSAEQGLRSALQQVRTEAATLKSRREASDRKLELARRTEERARAQVDAESRRVDAGTSIPLVVQQAEDSWRQARLRVVRAQVDRVQSAVSIDHLTGRLLDRYRDVAGKP